MIRNVVAAVTVRMFGQVRCRRPLAVQNGGPARRKDRHGTAVVEFAIVAPVFILLVFGIIEYGRMVMVQQMVTNAAREGARLGIIEGLTTSDIQTRVSDYLTAANLDGETTNVQTLPPQGADTGDRISVTVTIPFSSVSWLPAPMYLGGTTMTATAVMRREAVN